MVFFYYEINTDRFIQTTNMQSVSDYSGISYHRIYNWFKGIEGSHIHAEDGFICARSELVKGKQRLSIVGTVENIGSVSATPVTEVLQTGPAENSSYVSGSDPLPKRETKQPEKRDMSSFDEFFKGAK